ncbi:MAG: hypothetical protein EPN93_13810 [Spirochaetes bacterium]|nr:MAG: hypothetical protein EPN93_13810 [Spirochaetota bacterium]
MNKRTFLIPALLLSCTLACVLFTCSSAQKLDSFTETCAHCHGDRLQGVHNTVVACGDCHDLSIGPLSPDKMKDKIKREAVLSEPHIHKTKNMFRSTPSCFNCHRRGDF